MSSQCVSCHESSDAPVVANCVECNAALCMGHIFECHKCEVPMCHSCWVNNGKLNCNKCTPQI